MSKRRFEFVGGNSYKFWEIEITGNEVVVCFGRIGTDGQQQSKQFDDAAQAAKHAEKQIASKLKKGYAEVAVV